VPRKPGTWQTDVLGNCVTSNLHTAHRRFKAIVSVEQLPKKAYVPCAKTSNAANPWVFAFF